MRLCSGCGTKLPDSWRGKCDECKPKVDDDGIRSHSPVGATPARDVYAHLYRDPRWTKCSQIQRQRFPMCEAAGCKRLADLADHHVPAAIFVELCREQKRFLIAEAAFFYMGNLRSLCSSCHRLKSIEDDKLIANHGPWPDIFANPIRAPRKFF